MIQIILFAVFIGGVVIGGLVADRLGRLPTAEELQAEDVARLEAWSRSR